jgi:hypothetical protein
MSKMGDRTRVIRDNYRMAKEHDPKLGWILLGILALGIAITLGLIAAFGNPWTWAIVGSSATIVILSLVFSRRAMSSAYRSIEGQPGAAVAVVQNMTKAGWTITPAVAANKQQDLVHRAIARPGIVLIGEGTSPALAGLMATERKRTARFVSEAPISEIIIGSEEGQVAIAKLDKHLRKMPKVLAPGEVTTLRKRLDALASAPVPIPKGPMPKSGRVPRGGKLR